MSELHGYLAEQYKNGIFSFTWVPTEDMIADILTKPMSGGNFHRLDGMMRGYVKLN